MSRFTDLFQAPVAQPQPTPAPAAPKVEKVVPIAKALDKAPKI